MKPLLIAATGVLLIAVAPSTDRSSVELAAEPAAPTIVIILTDDEPLGLTDAMPVLRRRIQNLGATFTNYMLPTSLCCPSRASLLTGMFAHDTGVWNNVRDGG